MTGKDVLPKELLEKALVLKRFKYSPLGSELKKRTSVAEKQYEGLNKLFKSDKKEKPVTIKKEKPAITRKSNLMYDRKFSFSDYVNIKEYYHLSFTTKYDKLLSFYHHLNEFRNLVPQTEKQKLENFFFDLPKDADENLRHKIEVIINSNESLAENKIKN